MVDPPHALERAHVERILRPAVARALALKLPMGFPVGLGLLQRHHLRLDEGPPFLGHLRLQRLEPMLHRCEIMPLPDAAHAGGRHGHATLRRLVGHPHLAPRRLLDRELDDRCFHLRRHPVLQDRLAPGDLRQRRLAAGLVQLLEPVEAVPAVAHDPTGPRHVAQLLRQLQHPHLRLDDLLLGGHRLSRPFSLSSEEVVDTESYRGTTVRLSPSF
jgi:hypothetical protein